MSDPASELRSRFAAMSDAKLLEVLRNPADYRQDAYAIAVEVGTERGLFPIVEQEADEKSPFGKPGFKTIDVEQAPDWMVALFFLLPFIGGLVNMIWYMALREEERDPRIPQTMPKVLMGVATYALILLFFW